MNTKEKGKSKRGKAIIGIAMAAIMLASVFALAPMGVTKTVPPRTYDDVGGDITIDTAAIESATDLGAATLVTVSVGEEVTFNGAAAEVHVWGAYDEEGKPKTGFTEYTVLVGASWDAAGKKEGFYKVGDDLSGDTTFCGAGDNQGWFTVDTQEFTLDLEPAEKIAEDAPVYLEIATSNKEAGVMKITIKDEGGFEVSPTPISVNYDNMKNFASVTATGFSLTDIYPTGGDTYNELKIDTEALSMDKGKYTIYVKDKATEVQETIELTIGPKEISIEAPAEATVDEDVDFEITSSYPKADVMIVYDDGATDGGIGTLTDANGKKKFTHKFTDTGTYDVEVTIDSNNNGVFDDDDEDKKVKVKIKSGKITVEVPPTAVLGQTDIKITGTTTLDDDAKINIVIENRVTIGPLQESDFKKIDHDGGEFEVEWDTTLHSVTTGSYKVIVYWDKDNDNVRDSDEEYDSDSISLTSGELSFEVVDETISTVDDISVIGTAAGEPDEVRIILVGDGIAAYKVDIDVSEGEYEKDDIGVGTFGDWFTPQGDIPTPDEFDAGTYMLIAQHPGPDTDFWSYGTETENGRLLASKLDAWISNMETDVQDDIIAFGTIKISYPLITLTAVEAVKAGEPLNVSGTTTRADGTEIFIRVTGPGLDKTESTEVENDAFTLGLDTEGWTLGTYTIAAEDIDGKAMDEITVQVGEAAPEPTPTPEPTAEPTATAIPTAVPTAEPTAEPTPTPTEEPGFEAVFAIAGLLSIAYLVLRKRRE